LSWTTSIGNESCPAKCSKSQPRGRCGEPDGRSRAQGITVDLRSLSRDLGVPRSLVAQARDTHSSTIDGVASGELTTKPLHISGTPDFQRAVAELVPLIEQAAPGVPNARWIAIRLLDGDAQVEEALTSGRMAQVVASQQQRGESFSPQIALQGTQ
jgi:ferrous iron transport protein B